jgi:DNA-binding transcriptional regulator YbjK
MNKQTITDTALRLVRNNGLINLTRASVCSEAGIPEGSFTGIMGCTFTDFVKKLKHETTESDQHPAVIRSRADPKLRSEHILRTAVNAATLYGYNNMTREQVAEAAGVSMGLVSKYFKTMPQLRRDVMRYAVRNKILSVVAQGLAAGDKHAKKADEKLKREAAELLMG